MVRAMDIPSLLYIVESSPTPKEKTFVKAQMAKTHEIAIFRNIRRFCFCPDLQKACWKVDKVSASWYVTSKVDS